MSFALDGLIFATGWAHVLIAPYTKVEESFNLHAVHDMLMYRWWPATLHNYDHFTFPGAVPRTFIGSVLLSVYSSPVIVLAHYFGFVANKFDLQIIVRLVLASTNALGLCLLRRAVSKRFGRLTGLFFAILSISQFHIPFWMGRTLPNMFALFTVNLAMWILLNRSPQHSLRFPFEDICTTISILTFTAVVFRAEVALLLAAFTIYFLFRGEVDIMSVFRVGIKTAIASIALTVAVDSYFWGRLVWPELAGIYFNVYLGKSQEWGTSPWHTYFTSALPKLLLTSLPLSVLGYLADRRVREVWQPSIVFVGLMSYLGHKEWRFIVYVVPLFNIAAARGARWMVSQRKGKLIGRLLFLCALAMILANFALTGVLTLASMKNYPGGEALNLFNHMYVNATTVPHVHISNLAAQTGASLFLQVNSPPYPKRVLSETSHGRWVYDKTEGMTIADLTSQHEFTHLIVESPATRRVEKMWTTVGAVEGFVRWAVDSSDLKKRGWKLEAHRREELLDLVESVRSTLRMETEEKLWILERRTR